MTKAKCPNCGQEIGAGDRFCWGCGKDVSTAQETADTRRVTARVSAAVRAGMKRQLQAATLGEYEILAELGHGGMATVFLAHDVALDRKVAVKVMAPALLEGGSEMVERFKREARTAASLSHPQIIPIYAVRETGSLFFFVMKCVVGKSIDTIIKEDGALPVNVVRAVLGQVGSALGHAHRHGVVHRDVKPANVMIDNDGWVVVTDFGIAKEIGLEGLTVTGATVGTPIYMSPEQCSGREVTGLSDQYSLGVVAYEMLTGKVPFESDSLVGLMWAHVNDEVPPLTEVRPDCPVDLAAVVTRMLSKLPADRFATMDDAVTAMGGAPATTVDPLRSQLVDLAKPGPEASQIPRFRTPTSPIPQSRSKPPAASAAPAPARAASTTVPRPAVRARRRWWLAALPVVIVGGILLTAVRAGVFSRPVEAEPGRDSTAERGDQTPAVASLTIPPLPALTQGQRTRLRVRARDQAGAVVANPVVTWESLSPSVATVAGDGTVSGVAPGTAQIVARSGVHSASLTITVRTRAPPPPSVATRSRAASVMLNPATAALSVGERRQLRAIPLDGGGNELAARPVEWNSTAPDVAAVGATGLVEALSPGSAVIVATVDEASAEVAVTVIPPAVASVSLEPARADLEQGESVGLRAVVRDANGQPLSGRPTEWRSDDSSVATVSAGGQVRGTGPGRTKIFSLVEGRSASAEITVRAAPPAGPAPPSDPQTQIETIMAGYARAIESRDVNEIRRVYPNLGAEQEQGFRQLFDAVSELQVAVQVTGVNWDGASASATVEQTYTFRTAHTERQATSFIASFEWRSERWHLVGIQ